MATPAKSATESFQRAFAEIGQVGGHHLDVVDETPDEPDQRDGRAEHPEPPRVLHLAEQHHEGHPDQHDQGRLDEHAPVQPRLVQHALARQQVSLDVPHGGSLAHAGRRP